MENQSDFNFSDFENRMKSTINSLTHDFNGLRTGRASAGLLDNIKVDSYGSIVPIQQVGSVSVPDARQLLIQVWDKNTVKAVEKAIRDSELGLNPCIEGQSIRIPMPQLTQERRNEISKVAGKYAEEAKVAIRNIRREAMDINKKNEKDSKITEDEMHRTSDEVQKMTDAKIKEIDDLLAKKQKEIMAV